MWELRDLWGKNVRVHRQARTLTQKEFAELCGVTQGTVSRWEHGELVPTDAHKITIAEVLHIPAHLLFPLIRGAA